MMCFDFFSMVVQDSVQVTAADKIGNNTDPPPAPPVRLKIL